jgi:hypothetical protein
MVKKKKCVDYEKIIAQNVRKEEKKIFLIEKKKEVVYLLVN